MRREDFFQGLFAALRARNTEFIDARGDQHQKRFSRVVEWLDAHPKEGQRLGVCFFPSPFNGRYAEFDAALLRLQMGFLGAKNPFYPGMDLQFSPERAEAILSEMVPGDRNLFSELAEVFKGSDTPAIA
jgi:hypothetical protein